MRTHTKTTCARTSARGPPFRWLATAAPLPFRALGRGGCGAAVHRAASSRTLGKWRRRPTDRPLDRAGRKGGARASSRARGRGVSVRTLLDRREPCATPSAAASRFHVAAAGGFAAALYSRRLRGAAGRRHSVPEAHRHRSSKQATAQKQAHSGGGPRDSGSPPGARACSQAAAMAPKPGKPVDKAKAAAKAKARCRAGGRIGSQPAARRSFLSSHKLLHPPPTAAPPPPPPAGRGGQDLRHEEQEQVGQGRQVRARAALARSTRSPPPRGRRLPPSSALPPCPQLLSRVLNLRPPPRKP